MNASLIPVLSILAVLFHFMPNWMRPELFFAVTVDPAFRRTPEAARILHWYRIPLWIGTFAAIALIAATGLVAFAILAPVGFLVGFVLAQRRTAPHAIEPSPILEVNLSAPAETFPGGFVLTLPPFAALAALAFWAKTHWDQLPLQIPIHWGFHGPDHFMERTATAVYGLIAVDAAVCLFLLAMAWGILNWSRRIYSTGTAAANERRFRRINVQMLIALTYYAAAQAWISLAISSSFMPWTPVAFIVVTLTLVVFMALYIVLLVRAARSGAPVGDRTPDSCWKLGIFYINPNDPSLWVTKRFGIGYTINFGNRWSWAVMAVALVAVFAKAVLK
jgi:uncharacterized membrane protein